MPGKSIMREWDGVKFVDAKKDLRVMIQKTDVEKAKRKAVKDCVLAQACKRIFHAKRVCFLKSTAYVELPDKNGKPRVERFKLGAAERKLITDFDRGKQIIPAAGFLLRAPSRSNTLSARLLDKSRRRHDILEQGDKARPACRGVRRAKPKTVDLSVRNGTGMVKFLDSDGQGRELVLTAHACS